MDNSKLTIQNPIFWKQLKQTLEMILSKTEFLEPRKNDIKKLIDTIQTRIDRLRLKCSSTQLDKATQAVAESSISFFGEETIQRILKDPEIVKLSTELQNLISKLLPKLPPQEQRILKQTSIDFYKNTQKVLDSMNKLGMKVTYEEFKTGAQDFILKNIELMNLKSELIELQKQLKSKIANKKFNRNHKKLMQREKEIVHKMDSIKHSMDLPEVNNLFLSFSNDMSFVNELFSLSSELLNWANSMSESKNVDLEISQFQRKLSLFASNHQIPISDSIESSMPISNKF